MKVVRRSAIMDRLRRDGVASVSSLARELDVSIATIHRDLARLAEGELIERVHGGARLADGERTVTTAWDGRRAQNAQAKAQIATAALDWVEEGSTIFIDASTTSSALASALEVSSIRSLTVVTNSPVVAAEFDHDGVHLIVAPGHVDQNLRMIGGRWTTEFLSSLNFTTSFISAPGVTLEQGLSTSQADIGDVLQAVRRVSLHTVAMIDSSKFGKHSLLAIARPEELDALIVDDGLPRARVRDYRKAGVNLVVAAKERRSPSPRNAA
jgi:DeoR/GlpR family transcriptional regulator of sugar metabolism